MNESLISDLISQVNKLKSNFKNNSLKVELRTKQWDQFDKSIVQFNEKRNQRVIRLNVGGCLFSTYESTLKARENTFFTNELLKNEDLSQEIFIDRPGKHFDIILSYLRYGSCSKSYLDNLSGPEKNSLSEEAEFYGVKYIF